MFTEPMEVPPNKNRLQFIWTYVLKDVGMRKAHAQCNGSPKLQGTITLREKYTASLDQTASKIF